MQLHRASVALACLFALTVAACDKNDVVGPSRQDVAGTYVATQLLTTTGGVKTDQLAAGASITLVLNADGRTTGRLFVPASTTPQVDLPLDGTWDFSGPTDIDLTSTADTFLRDMVFAVSGNSLIGDQTFGSTRIQVTLTKQ